MNKPDYRSSMNGRSTGRDHGGDSERLTDQIFGSTRVMAKVHLDKGAIQITTNDLADYYVARCYLVQHGYRRDMIYRGI